MLHTIQTLFWLYSFNIFVYISYSEYRKENYLLDLLRQLYLTLSLTKNPNVLDNNSLTRTFYKIINFSIHSAVGL